LPRICSRPSTCGPGNYEISDKSVKALKEAPSVPRLRWLELDGTSITHKSRNKLRERFPRLA